MPRKTPRDPHAMNWRGVFTVECRDESGETVWRDQVENAVFDDGERSMLDTFFRGAAAPSSFYVGSVNAAIGSLPADTTTLAGIAAQECVGSGYSRLALARNSTDWPSLVLNGGDYEVTSKQVSWTVPGAAWAAQRFLFICTAASGNSGLLVAMAQYQQDRTPQTGQTLIVSYALKLQ